MGFKNFYISIHDKSKIIKAFFRGHKNLNVTFKEEVKPMGTIGSLKLLKEDLKVLLLLATVTFYKTDFRNIYDFHKENVLTLVVA